MADRADLTLQVDAHLAIAVWVLCALMRAAIASNMKTSIKVTVCAVLSALAAVVMLMTNLPIMLYAVPAIAGALFIIPAIEFNGRWGLLCFFVTVVISLLLPTEKEALTVFIGFLGYYPILKMLLERIGNRVVEYALKIAAFNVAIVASYYVIIKLLGINVFEASPFSIKVTVLVLLLLGNAAFLVFDFALTGIIRMYFIKFRMRIRKIMGMTGKF